MSDKQVWGEHLEEHEMPEPASLLDSVREERAKYGTPLTNAEMGELINAVAWKRRDEGWGLAGKDVGAHTIQPGSGIHISRDLLVHAPTAGMYDVLIDVAGAATPTWGAPLNQDMPFVPPTGLTVSPPPPDGRDAQLRTHLTEIRQHALAALDLLD